MIPNSHSLVDLAKVVDGKLKGDRNLMIKGVASFEVARPDQVTFAQSAKYVKAMAQSRAGAILMPPGHDLPDRNTITVESPQLAFIKLVDLFHPPPTAEPGIHPTAVVEEDVVLGKEVAIGPQVVIGNRVRIGDRAWIEAGVIIEDDVVIGDDAHLYANVTIRNRSRLGNRVVLHPGAVIGADGFGYVSGPTGAVKVPQIGYVQIDDDVEIGANTTVDRATFGKTWIQAGVKIDNLVQIGHNCTVGANTLIIALAALAGSVKIGKGVIVAGQSGIADHLEIGDGATIGPKAGVAKSVAAGQTVIGGVPAMPYKLWLRVQRVINKLPEMKKRMDQLEKILTKDW